MLIKGQNTDHIKFGNSFTQDGLRDEKFDYMLSNPPFGVEWKKIEEDIKKESEKLGMSGRFGAGLPRISDGSFLFLQHMISKMRPENGGARLGIVFNGSPLFSGGACSGESEIRKWIIENDMLEAIIALPDQLFYNTGISTYIWIVTNRKPKDRKGKVQLVNAVGFFKKMARSLGNKRNEISDEHIAEVTKIYGAFKNGEFCKIFPNEYFGYTRVTVERPLRLNFQASPERIAPA
jgi:Type I restriction-modification system methyltransferase subunit